MTASRLIRLTYASRSTRPVPPGNLYIDPAMGRILAKSRANNRRRGLVGVLYFGDGHFFQCLEGEEAAIDALYETIGRDDRHTDLRVLDRREITALSFSRWSMKFVPVESQVTSLLARHGHARFDPYALEPQVVERLVELLAEAAGEESLAGA